MITDFATMAIALQFLGGIVLLNALYVMTSALHRYFLRPGKDLTKFGKWAVVTGATDGIGKAVAMEMAKKGMNVLLISRTESKLKELQSEMSAIFRAVHIHTLAHDFNVMDGAARAKIQKKIDSLADIGVLFNNVGVSYEYPEYFDQLSDERVESLLNLNVNSTIWMTRIVLPSMLAKKSGAIVNMSSGSARLNVPLLSEYSAAKKCIEQFTLCMAAEYAGKGVSFQCQTPMFVTTKLSKLRHPSLFTPTPRTYAPAALAAIGYEPLSIPYWPHAVQIAVFSAVPDFIFSKLSLSQHLSLRKRALKKKAKKSE